MFSWMMWTLPTAVFFICIALMLAGMTVWELRSPTVLRKGFLPIATTRGDRLFIGLVLAAYINLGFLGMGEQLMDWMQLNEEPSVWISFVISMLVLGLVIKKRLKRRLASGKTHFLAARSGLPPGMALN